MKTTSLFALFLILIGLVLIGLPAISSLIDDNFILPSQRIGNIGYFGWQDFGMILPGLNNSYITYDPALMAMPDRMDFIDGTGDIPNKTYDVVVIGDSFTQVNWGLSNGICRLGNYSTITFYYTNLKSKSGSPAQLVENLISSGFIESAKPKFLVIEFAGRNDLGILSRASGPEDRIAYDVQSLNYWIRYGDRVDDIVTGIKPNTKIPLLDLMGEREWNNNTPDWGETWLVKTYGGEPALFEHPLLNDNVTARFSRISIPPNTTLLTKVGRDQGSGEQEHTVAGVRFIILVTDEDGTESRAYNESVSPGKGVRLVALPMDKYAGKVVNITFLTNIDENGSGDWAYWINPTLVSSSFTSTEPNKDINDGGTIQQILQIPAVLAKFHEKPILSYIWDNQQSDKVLKVKNAFIFTTKNQLNIPFYERIHKAKLTKRVHSSNVEYDTIYYFYGGDVARESYTPKSLEIANNNLNNLSERLEKYNITLLFIVPPDTSHIYEEYYVHQPDRKASRIYEDLTTIPKKYQYIDAYSVLKERVHAGELDLYPIGTTHWAPTAGSYVAEETVMVMSDITSRE
jgi:hypothetical protein